MDDEFYFTPDPIATPLVLSAVVDVFTGDIPQDDCSFEDFLQVGNVLNGCTAFVNSLLPLLYFLSPCGCKPLASQGSLEVFHNPLCHAVEAAVSQRSKVGGVRVSDGVEAVGNCGDRVGILVEHAVNSGQHPRLCVPRDLDDPLALLSLSPDWIKLVFKDQIIIGLTEKLESQNKIALWESCKKLGSPDVGHPSVQGQPSGSGMHAVGDLDVTNVKWVIFFHPPSREDCRGTVNLKPQRISTHWSAGSLTGGGTWSSRSVHGLCGRSGRGRCLSSSIGMGLSKMNLGSYSASISSISSSIVTMLLVYTHYHFSLI